MNYEFVLKVLKLFSDNDCCDDVWWRCDEEYAPVTFIVNCNDTFDYACSDAETVTPENFAILEQSFADCDRLCGNPIWASTLFCARLRKLEIIADLYRTVPAPIRPLFDEAWRK